MRRGTDEQVGFGRVGSDGGDDNLSHDRDIDLLSRRDLRVVLFGGRVTAVHGGVCCCRLGGCGLVRRGSWGRGLDLCRLEVIAVAHGDMCWRNKWRWSRGTLIGEHGWKRSDHPRGEADREIRQCADLIQGSMSDQCGPSQE